MKIVRPYQRDGRGASLLERPGSLCFAKAPALDFWNSIFSVTVAALYEKQQDEIQVFSGLLDGNGRRLPMARLVLIRKERIRLNGCDHRRPESVWK